MSADPVASAAPLVCFCADDGSICLGDVAKCLACAERIEKDPDAPCLNEPEGSY